MMMIWLTCGYLSFCSPLLSVFLTRSVDAFLFFPEAPACNSTCSCSDTLAPYLRTSSVRAEDIPPAFCFISHIPCPMARKPRCESIRFFQQCSYESQIRETRLIAPLMSQLTMFSKF
ncbi:hypothetical protein C8R43DRAFT_984741 [Mycena crocata]|nr:hypothetical protein C8R43DRAFT_984741 [Mycena crocata]